MSTEEEFDQELGSFGYTLDPSALRDGTYQVRRLDGHGGVVATFTAVDDVTTFLRRMAESDNHWCISLDHGHVDVDRTTGEVSPRDGGPLFNLQDLHPEEWSGASDDIPSTLGLATLMTADQVCVRSTTRPPYGGLWFKRP